MSVCLFQIGIVIKFSKKGKRLKEEFGARVLKYQQLVYCGDVGRGRRGFVEDDTKKKKKTINCAYDPLPLRFT